MSNTAFVFPGQGSQSLGMLAELGEAYPRVRQTFEEASDALGRDLWTISQQGPEETLNQTETTQPAVLTAGVATWRVWCDEGGPAALVCAGHSLGEYTALVAAGVLEFSVAVGLVARRGRFMQEAVPPGEGAMAAVLGLEDEAVAELCQQAAQGEVCEPVNFNTPGQVVIAGRRTAVERAVATAQEQGRKAVLLPVSVPSHCALMEPAATRLEAVLKSVDVATPSVPVLHNVDVTTAGSPDEIRARLVRQLFNPVRWVDTVRETAAMGAQNLVELGPGKVLTGLARRIDRSLQALAVNDPNTLQKALEATHA